MSSRDRIRLDGIGLHGWGRGLQLPRVELHQGFRRFLAICGYRPDRGGFRAIQLFDVARQERDAHVGATMGGHDEAPLPAPDDDVRFHAFDGLARERVAHEQDVASCLLDQEIGGIAQGFSIELAAPLGAHGFRLTHARADFVALVREVERRLHHHGECATVTAPACHTDRERRAMPTDGSRIRLCHDDSIHDASSRPKARWARS